MQILIAILCGLLFGAGLVISDMVNPGRVLAFLDVAGAFDPSLAFVMGGALIPSGLAYIVRRRRAAPVLAEKFFVPAGGVIDTPLVAGAVLFGLGWGLVGLCPGPSLAALVVVPSALFPAAALFGLAMAGGMLLYRVTPARWTRRTA